MTVRDFEGKVVLPPPEPFRMPLTLRVIPLEGVDVTELPHDSGWEQFQWPATVPAGLE